MNNTFRTAFDLTDTASQRLGIEIDGGELDYYLILGPELSAVVERFTAACVPRLRND